MTDNINIILFSQTMFTECIKLNKTNYKDDQMGKKSINDIKCTVLLNRLSHGAKGYSAKALVPCKVKTSHSDLICSQSYSMRQSYLSPSVRSWNIYCHLPL